MVNALKSLWSRGHSAGVSEVTREEGLMAPRSHKSRSLSKAARSMIAVLLVAVALGSGYVGLRLGARYQIHQECCQIPLYRSLVISAKEKLGFETSYSRHGLHMWVTEVVFPGVKNGFFLDVGSGDGNSASETKALEQKGWTGICIDAFPRNMQGRSCQIFKEVVSSEAGKRVKFVAAGAIGGIIDTLGRWNGMPKEAPIVEFTTVTLGDILERAQAPRFIHFVSMDIEGAELEAIKGFPFDKYQIGALMVEHNFEELKRTQIRELLKSHGYKRVHTWMELDFYVPGADGSQA